MDKEFIKEMLEKTEIVSKEVLQTVTHYKIYTARERENVVMIHWRPSVKPMKTESSVEYAIKTMRETQKTVLANAKKQLKELEKQVKEGKEYIKSCEELWANEPTIKDITVEVEKTEQPEATA